jgi:nitrogenase subunit NifH
MRRRQVQKSMQWKGNTGGSTFSQNTAGSGSRTRRGVSESCDSAATSTRSTAVDHKTNTTTDVARAVRRPRAL